MLSPELINSRCIEEDPHEMSDVGGVEFTF